MVRTTRHVLFKVSARVAHISSGRTANEEGLEPIEMRGWEADNAEAMINIFEQPLALICVCISAEASAKRLVIAIGEVRWIWRVDCQACAPAAAILFELLSVQAQWRRKLGEHR